MPYSRTDPTPILSRGKGRPPKGREHVGTLNEILKSIYLREWKTDHLDLGILYRSPQLSLVVERHFAGEHDATEKAVLVLRHWFARYCGERAVQNALALGRGRDVRLARLAAWLLVFRLEHPELTRKEEAEALEREFGLPINASAHRRAVDTMFASIHRYGADLLSDLASKNPEKWEYYELQYGVWPSSSLSSPSRRNGKQHQKVEERIER